MDPNKKNIKLIVEEGNYTYNIETYTFEYRSLMHLITDKIYTENFGDCGGMGRCGSCIIEILNQPATTYIFERNELTTLERSIGVKPNIRLACQMLIDEGINNLHCSIK
jgi:2Fe-2S ferredoxin